MKKLKYQILFTILFMTIGIAAVTTNLVTNGNTNIASNPDDFLVYFSDAKIDGIQDLSLVDSKTSLVFNKELSAVGQSIVITYDVTNASKNYDADVEITCTQSTEYLTISNSFDTSNNLSARSTKSGTLSITLSKSYTGPDLSQEISCTINASAVERTTQGSATVPDAVVGYYPMLMARPEEDDMFWSFDYRSKITEIKFEDTINIPNDAVESWDISDTQDGSVMAYVVENDDYYINPNDINQYSGGYYLVIQSTDTVYGNHDMSSWFAGFDNIKLIDGMEQMNTISTTNMNRMFSAAGRLNSNFTLDLGDKFDTSNVTDMNSMFANTGRDSSTFELYLGNKFDTSNVIDMSYMFFRTGAKCQNFTLDLGENFNTVNVTNMDSMFFYTGHKSLKFTLDLGDKFDTSNVTDMNQMFYYTGFSNENFTLDLGEKFDTSNVITMDFMFTTTGYNSTKLNFSITIRNPNTTSYNYMFESVATKDGSQIIVNYTSQTSDLVDLMIATKSPDSNVIKGTQVD